MERKETGRHLAAILFTDIVGYTGMMQRDETLAIAAVRRHHEVLEEQIPSHDGKIYQYYGDGSLSIFTSATQAVTCALEIQKELQKEPVVPLRIGIHIGEIHYDQGKIFGDGVNVASRIESIGQGGTVFFSRDVYEKVRNHTEFQIMSIGKFEFKNVDDPIEVFALTNPEVRTPDLKLIDGKLKVASTKKRAPLVYVMGGTLMLLAILSGLFLFPKSKNKLNSEGPNKESIAVLPFSNLSDGEEADFLSIGIAEDILTQLAQIRGLKVISRSSSMRYKDSDKPIRTIAKELGVTSILEGSVRKYDKNLRVSVQLTNGVNESLIWAADFDRQFEDVLNMQKDIALLVSEKLEVALSPEIKDRFEDKTNVNPEAYILYQKGKDQLLRSRGTKEEMLAAIDYFEKSIAIDSQFARAWIGLSDAYFEAIFWHRFEAREAIDRGRKAAEHVLVLDASSGEGYGVLGSIQYLERQFTEAEKNLGKAIEQNPNYSLAYDRLGWISLYRGNTDEAIRLFRKAIELDPLATRLQGSIGNAFAVVGRYDEGIQNMEQYLSQSPKDDYLLWTLGFLYARKGDFAKAIEYFQKRSIGLKTNWALGYSYAKSGQREKAEEILHNNLEKMKKEVVPDFMVAVQMCGLGRDRECLDYLTKGVNNTGENFFLVGLENDPFFVPLHKFPEFKTLVDKVKKDFLGQMD